LTEEKVMKGPIEVCREGGVFWETAPTIVGKENTRYAVRLHVEINVPRYASVDFSNDRKGGGVIWWQFDRNAVLVEDNPHG